MSAAFSASSAITQEFSSATIATTTTQVPLTSTNEPSLVAVCDDVTAITRVLQALHFKMPGSTTKRIYAVVKVTQTGIRFTIEEPQQFQANAFLTKALFRIYELTHDAGYVFKIAFDTLLDVLNVFGGGGGGGGGHHGGHHGGSVMKQTEVRLAYSPGTSEHLIVILKHGGSGDVSTRCRLRTLDCEMPMQIGDLMHQKQLNQMIINAAALKEAFGELDWSSASVELMLSPNAPHFRLTTGSQTGQCQVSFAKESDVFSNFSVSTLQIQRYALTYLMPAAKGLAEASTASCKTNSDGLLLIQMAVDLSTARIDAAFMHNDSVAFVDFYIVPLEDENERDDGEESQYEESDADNDSLLF